MLNIMNKFMEFTEKNFKSMLFVIAFLFVSLFYMYMHAMFRMKDCVDYIDVLEQTIDDNDMMDIVVETDAYQVFYYLHD